jgi:hypothetical protein
MSKPDISDIFKDFDINQGDSFTRKQIRKNYYRLSLKYHPDKQEREEDKKNTSEKFIRIQTSYEYIQKYMKYCDVFELYSTKNMKTLSYVYDDNFITKWVIYDNIKFTNKSKKMNIMSWDKMMEQCINFFKTSANGTGNTFIDIIKTMSNEIIQDKDIMCNIYSFIDDNQQHIENMGVNAELLKLFGMIIKNKNDVNKDDVNMNDVNKTDVNKTKNNVKMNDEMNDDNIPIVLYVSFKDCIHKRILTYNVKQDDKSILDKNTLYIPCWHNELEFVNEGNVYNVELVKITNDDIYIENEIDNKYSNDIVMEICINKIDFINKFKEYINCFERNELVKLTEPTDRLDGIYTFDEYETEYNENKTIIDKEYYVHTNTKLEIKLLIHMGDMYIRKDDYEIIIYNRGIPKINTDEIFDISDKSNICVRITYE